MNVTLDGKTAVVTGGGSGIGRAISLRLAADGVRVAVWGRTAASTEETVAMIASQGGKAIACVGDATREDDIAASLARTQAAFGSISILVNNAGIAPYSPFLDIEPDDFQEVLRANVLGPFLCSQAVIPDMLSDNWGRIVNITSCAAQDGMGTMAHYAASKAAPPQRAGHVDEVAAACAYLVSEHAAYVTGQGLNLNGGRYLA